jgi:hypothetical protein
LEERNWSGRGEEGFEVVVEMMEEKGGLHLTPRFGSG